MPRTSEAASCTDGPRARRAASCIEKSGDRRAGASRLPRPETCRPARVTPEPDGDPGSKPPFAVVYGATGLAGRQLMEALGRRGFEGLCLSRRSRPAPHGLPPGFSWKPLREEEDLCVPSTAVLFSLVPISALPALLERTGGGSRLIALSSSSVRFKAESSDPWERRQAQALSRAEQEVRRLCRNRGIVRTIFRPTLIYDPGRDRNVSAIAAFVRRFGFFPVVRPGIGRRQPVHAADVARAMAAAVHAPRTRDALLELPGGETLTYREMVCRIFESLGRRPVLLPLPLGLARTGFHVWRTLTGTPYSVAGLERMNADLVLDPEPLQDALGIVCRPFLPEFPDPPGPRR